jgi:hypothetical protein
MVQELSARLRLRSRKRGTLTCLIRDLSEKGARIIFSDIVTLRVVERQTLRPRGQRHRNDEIGLGFISAERSAEAQPTAGEVTQRVAARGRNFLAARTPKRLKAEKPDAGDEAATRRAHLAFVAHGLIVSRVRSRGKNIMSKAYWVATYRSISDPDALA